MTETAFVTLLFTDLVGSTELSQRLGEDAAEVLRSEHTAVLRDAVEASNGGREVKHLGDGIMAVFTSPSEAVRCAVAMQQGVDRHNRKLPESLGLRVGLHVGEVTVKDDDYFGTAVVVAERLSKRAAGGQIIASDVVRSVVGTRGGHTFKELGPVELKGIDDPVESYELGWEPLRDEAAPLPSLFRSVERLVFVGRTEEFERLGRAWKLAASGERQIALLSGEPGIGKTRLCTELAFDVYESGGLVLYGRCDEDPTVPYQPFAEALQHYVEHCPVEELIEHVSRHGGEIARIVPELIKRVPDAPPPIESESADPQADREAERFRLFEAAAALIRCATERTPLLLVLDDLHWATRPTLLLLRRILRETDNWRLLVLGTYRDTDLARTHPLAEMLADWRRELDVERISLTGLDEDGVLRYIETASGEERSPEFEALAHALHAETEGNPFFIGQVLRHLAESGVIYQKDDRWTYDGSVEQLGIPQGVREVVGRRLSRLSETANRALAVGAVLGGEFDVDVLERVLELDVLDALDEAAAARVVVEIPDKAGNYRFTHTLVRQTLYEELSSARRTRLHQKAGEALESLYASDLEPILPSLARHFAEGARAGNVGRAADYAIRAAQQAFTRAAYEEAMGYAERAMQVLDLDDSSSARERAELWLVVAAANSMLMDSDQTTEASFNAARFAREAGDVDQLARAAEWSMMAVFVGRAQEAAELADDALTIVTEEYPGLRSAIVTSKIWSRQNMGQKDDLEEMCAEAVDLGRRADDSRPLAFALFMRGWLLRDALPATDLLAIAEEAIAAGRNTGDPYALANTIRVRRSARLAVGDRRGFEEDGEEIGRHAEQLQSGLLSAIALGTRAMSALFDGRSDEAEAYVEEYISKWRSTPLMFTYTLRMTGIRWEQGRLDEAERFARSLLGVVGPLTSFGLICRAVLAAVTAARGELETTRELVDALMGDFASLALDGWRLGPLCFLAEAAAELGDAAIATEVFPLVSERHNELSTMGDGWFPTGALDRFAGILAATTGDFEEAAKRFEAALVFEEGIPAPAYATRTRYWFARMLIDRGDADDSERATALLDACIAKANEFGMADLESKARTLREQI